MSTDEFSIDVTSLPDEETEKFAYWQTRALAAQVEVLNLTRRLLEADRQLIQQQKTITDQANRVIKLNGELRTLQAESPWLAVVRKHLNSSTPVDLDCELQALTDWYRDKKDEAELLTRRVAEQAALLSEYQNSDQTPLN